MSYYLIGLGIVIALIWAGVAYDYLTRDKEED